MAVCTALRAIGLGKREHNRMDHQYNPTVRSAGFLMDDSLQRRDKVNITVIVMKDTHLGRLPLYCDF